MGRHIYLGMAIIMVLLILSEQEETSSAKAPYQHAAVATEVSRCSKMGKEILHDGGSAVDATITSLLCIAVVNPESSGLGGGFSMIVYIHKTKEAIALIATETAPAAASPHMFANRTESIAGNKAFAVPGEVMGLWEAHKRFGKLPWKDLFQPVIQMAEAGFQVSEHMSWILNRLDLNEFPILREVFSRDDGELMHAGDTITSHVFAKTLRKIAANGAQEFYTGSIAEDLVRDIQEAGGIITLEDLASYQVEWKPAPSMTYKNKMKLFSTPLTGQVLQYILNVLDEYGINEDDFSSLDKVKLYHRYLETTKIAEALRQHLGHDSTSPTVQQVLAAIKSKEFAKQSQTVINDTFVTYSTRHEYDILRFVLDDFAAEEEGKEDLGGDTSHVSVLAENGDAVSVTASVGDYFGGKIYSRRLGVWMNSHMANFYFPNRESAPPIWPWPNANALAPNHRYMSTVCPSILVDDEVEDGTVQMVIGASGGAKIVSTNAWVILRTIWMGASLQDAINEKRIYNYLPPKLTTYYEGGFPDEILEGLKAYGHIAQNWWKYSVVQAIKRTENGHLDAYCDPRKQGQPDGY